MPAHLRIATWNLDRSGIRRTGRIRRQVELMMEIGADIWILTETHASVSLPGYCQIASDPDPGYHFEGESCVAIFARSSLRQISTHDPFATVCAEFEGPSGPIMAYGTIITYGADGVSEGLARPWERHRKAVQQQTAEWRELQERYPSHLRCIAGDFNMNLDGRRWYGVKDAKEAVLMGLEDAGMYCATAEDLQRPPHNLSRSTVDHICLSNSMTDVALEVWMDKDLSDHNGVLIDLRK